MLATLKPSPEMMSRHSGRGVAYRSCSWGTSLSSAYGSMHSVLSHDEGSTALERLGGTGLLTCIARRPVSRVNTRDFNSNSTTGRVSGAAVGSSDSGGWSRSEERNPRNPRCVRPAAIDPTYTVYVSKQPRMEKRQRCKRAQLSVNQMSCCKVSRQNMALKRYAISCTLLTRHHHPASLDTGSHSSRGQEYPIMARHGCDQASLVAIRDSQPTISSDYFPSQIGTRTVSMGWHLALDTKLCEHRRVRGSTSALY